jgi:putative FmdB family regulatory protein
MPIYVYQCQRCECTSEVFQRSVNSKASAQPVCEHCGSTDLQRAVTSFATSRSEIDRLQQLDPRYYKKVDDAIARTPEADPMRHLQKMTPFSSAKDPGPPINF